jgi:hypothetical protein
VWQLPAFPIGGCLYRFRTRGLCNLKERPSHLQVDPSADPSTYQSAIIMATTGRAGEPSTRSSSHVCRLYDSIPAAAALAVYSSSIILSTNPGRPHLRLSKGFRIRSHNDALAEPTITSIDERMYK